VNLSGNEETIPAVESIVIKMLIEEDAHNAISKELDEKTKRTIEEMNRHEDEILGGYEFTVSSPETLSGQASESGSEVKNKRVKMNYESQVSTSLRNSMSQMIELEVCL
jgi:hypothetical protein